MSGLRLYTSLKDIVIHKLRNELSDIDVIILFAHNRTGKTRLSKEFKDVGKQRNNGNADTFYFNAYTEDLFTWDNDLEADSDYRLMLNYQSDFLHNLGKGQIEAEVEVYLNKYTDINFRLHYFDAETYQEWLEGNDYSDNEIRKRRYENHVLGKPRHVSFSNAEKESIKISRGEQNIFVWCLYMAVCERVISNDGDYDWVKYFYIDDPISSLDDNHAILVACDLANLIRRAANRVIQTENGTDEQSPVKITFSSHHSLFFNVIYNELSRAKEDEPSVIMKRYFLHKQNSEGKYTIRSTDDTPFFHHVATLTELKRAADPEEGVLYTYHFNALRSIMEKTASFFGHSNINFCLKILNNEDAALYNRALQLLSHGKYAIAEPAEMGDDNKDLFRRILNDFVEEFKFELPEILSP